MKKSHTLMALAGVCCSALLVTACHQNPLARNDKEKSANFVMNASMFAEKKANRMVSGTGYKQCMTENIQGFNCPKLFVDMLIFAKDNQEYKGLTVADLKDKQAYQLIASAYDNALFNRI